MNKLLAGILALGFACISACGGSAPPPPKDGGKGACTAPKPSGPKKGKSYLSEYNSSMKAAFTAEGKYNSADGDAQQEGSAKYKAYIEWAEHLYAALAFAKKHTNNGHSWDSLPKMQQLKKQRSGDFKNAQGPSNHPRVKDAIKKWQEAE